MTREQKTSWTFLDISQVNIGKFCRRYKVEIQAITNSAFQGQVDLSDKALKKSLLQSTHVGLVKQGAELAGFCFLNARNSIRLYGKTVVWINKIAIRQQYQHQGLGLSRLLKDLPSITGTSLGYIGCCTQNSGLINSMTKVGKNFPLTRVYGTPEGIAAWSYISLQVPQVQDKLMITGPRLDTLLNSNHGILKGGYERKINVSQVALRRDIAETLSMRNFCAEDGDMLIMLTEL